jgi:hypothetical protein
MGGCGARARFGELLPAMMVGGLGQEVWCGKGRHELITPAMSCLVNKCPQDHNFRQCVANKDDVLPQSHDGRHAMPLPSLGLQIP